MRNSTNTCRDVTRTWSGSKEMPLSNSRHSSHHPRPQPSQPAITPTLKGADKSSCWPSHPGLQQKCVRRSQPTPYDGLGSIRVGQCMSNRREKSGLQSSEIQNETSQSHLHKNTDSAKWLSSYISRFWLAESQLAEEKAKHLTHKCIHTKSLYCTQKPVRVLHQKTLTKVVKEQKPL